VVAVAGTAGDAATAGMEMGMVKEPSMLPCNQRGLATEGRPSSHKTKQGSWCCQRQGQEWQVEKTFVGFDKAVKRDISMLNYTLSEG
jgi:malic enzyme